LLPYVVSQDANIEVLTLLLALSDDPTRAIEFDEQKFVLKEVVEKGITWEDILAEEPLEGDHWNDPEYSGSDDEDDWTYETTLSHSKKDIEKEAVEKKAIVQVPQEKVPEEFLDRQYWVRRQRFGIINEQYDEDIDFGGTSSLKYD
jgi:Gamma-Tubulin ring complex non-core subunit mod21, N-terminal